MRNGLVLFTSDRGIRPADLAVAAEERGFDTFYVPEHTHIPVRRTAAHPGTKDETLPDDRYLRTLDTKQWDDFEACFLPEATADYNGLEFADRAALVDYMRANLGEGMITLHQVHHPEISVDGDTATARWYLQDKVLVAAFGFMLEGAAFYEDRYVRTPEGWRVAHTGYRRTYEATYDLADLPSLRIKGPGEHTHV